MRLYVVGAFFHQLRVIATVVSVIKNVHYPLWIYSKVTPSPPWDRRVRHSQGEVEGTLFEPIIRELRRLNKYYREGFLFSCKEILAYFETRDQAP